MRYQIILLILIAVFCSCNNETTKITLTQELAKQEPLTLNLPQTAIKSQKVRGSIKYSTILDSLLPEDISSRYIFLHLTTSSNKRNLTIESIKNEREIIFEDTVGNGVFDFEIIFEKSGSQIFNGVVEDIMILNKPLEDQDKVKIFTKETSVSQDIFVKD